MLIIKFEARQEKLEELGMTLIIPLIEQRYLAASKLNFRYHKRSKIKLMMLFLDNHYKGVFKSFKLL